MEEKMFCYQCEQRMDEKACTISGVCGKTPDIAALQDLIIYQLKGICTYANEVLRKGGEIDGYIVKEIEDALFMTLTNVNFNFEDHIYKLKRLQELKEVVKIESGKSDKEECLYTLSRTSNEILKDAKRACILCDEEKNEDMRSLKETIKYGLKGIAAYGHQARALGYKNAEVDRFYVEALDYISDKDITYGELLELLLKTGEISVKVMEVLDKCNTEKYEHPTMTKVLITRKKGPFIIVSGHDLKDLEELLEQTKDKGINIYTHGEMLPANSYPHLKKYKHLIGNFGSAWQNQQKEFSGIPGCILMTTNCIMKPLKTYEDRIFTTSVVGYDNVAHIEKNSKNGVKDFTPIINKALELGGFTEEEEEKRIIIGFGRNETLKNAEKIVQLVKDGKIRHFFLVGGCDGAKPGRNYYTRFAEIVPKDCVILTLACGKFRFNKLEFGDIEGIPRLLDVGQCNDAYSAVKIANALAEAFNTDINSLPLSIILSWYEQKAVADFLALIYLGVKNIKLGPSIPSFLSKNLLEHLFNNYHLEKIKTPEEDLKEILGE